MKRVSDSKAAQFQKTMLKGSLAAAAPGLVAVVAAFCAGQSFLQNYIGMSTMGVAALGVIFFGTAYLFFKGHLWAGLPSIFFTSCAVWFFTTKAARLLMLYYTHNSITTFSDIVAPFSFISLHLVLVLITFSLTIIIFKALKVCSKLSPQPINKFVWGAMGLWTVVIVLDCMDKFQ